MNACELQAIGNVNGLVLVDRPAPVPGPGEVVVRVRAASLNYRDLLVILGTYGKVTLPLTPLSDGAGEVHAVGPGVSRWKPGDRVAATFFPDWIGGEVTPERTRAARGAGSTTGVLAQFVSVPEAGLVRIPAHLTDAEAATLPCAALTAWNALVGQGPVHAGESVVVLGTGGVSLFALQFAVLHGARVFVTSSSDDKLRRARELGADAGVNYRTTPQWEESVLEWTGGRGADHVIEVGGAGTFSRSLKATRAGGHVALIGVLAGLATELRVTDILMRSLRVQGVFVGSRDLFEEMNRAIELHALRPVVDRIVPLAEIRQAYEYLQSGQHFGKVVVSLD